MTEQNKSVDPDCYITNQQSNVIVYTGRVRRQYGVDTAINKQPVSGDIYLNKQGLTNDECADTKHHGGIERALHQYPKEHYAYWQQHYPNTKTPWQVPGMGENLSTFGMTEESVHIGDQYQIGDAIIEVSQPRSPCFKVNRKWDQTDLSMKMQMLSKCGWLYRVIKPGLIPVNTTMAMISRDENSLSVKAICDIYFGDPLNKNGLDKLLKLDKLSSSWREKIITRLETGKVENWNFRLKGKG